MQLAKVNEIAIKILSNLSCVLYIMKKNNIKENIAIDIKKAIIPLLVRIMQ